MLNHRNIVLGVTGGIAAYKACDLARRLREKGAEVRVAMTDAAQEFVTPLTFQALTGHPVRTDLFSAQEEQAIGHISLADWADGVVVAPCTADFVSKAARGAADDFLSTLVLASNAPILLCPSMNHRMYENPLYKANEELLLSTGRFRILEPDSGELACGHEGKGRLPAVEDIVAEVEGLLKPLDLKGRNVLVTAGPTREALDSVRFISNRSTGKMGFALARAARSRGGRVTLVHGPTCLREPVGMECIGVRSASEMADEVRARFVDCDILIMCAAVADYRPAQAIQGKRSKGEAAWTLELERTDDILASLKDIKGGKVVVGFAAQHGDPREKAMEKLKAKGLDAILANDISLDGQGFGADENAGYLIDSSGNAVELPLMGKSMMAHRVLDLVVELLG